MTGTFDKHSSNVGYLDTDCLSSVTFVVPTEFCDVCCADSLSSVKFVVPTV